LTVAWSSSTFNRTPVGKPDAAKERANKQLWNRGQKRTKTILVSNAVRAGLKMWLRELLWQLLLKVGSPI